MADLPIAGQDVDIISAIPTGANTIGKMYITDGTDDATVRDVTGAKALDVSIVDGSGSQITSFGGGTQYTEGDVDVSITGTAALAEGPSDTLEALQVDASKNLKVSIEVDNVGIGGGVQYTEGDTDASITGTAVMWEDTSDTLRSVSAANPFPVDIISGSSSNTEYTEGDVDATITGVAMMWEDAADTLSTISSSNPLPVDGSGVTQPVSAASLPLPTGASTSANQTTIIGHVDGIEGLLTTIDADTSTIAGAVSGTEMQVDVVTSALPSGASTSANQTTIIGHVDGIEGLLTTIDSDTSVLATAVYTEDDASVANPTGNQLLARRRDTLSSETSADGDVTALNSTAKGELYVKHEDTASVSIEGSPSGNFAEVDSSGRLLVSNVSVTPPASTSVIQTEFDGVSGTDDNLYTITNGTTLTIQQFFGGAESSTAGTVIELYEDPNGDLTVLNEIAIIFAAGVSNFTDLSESFTGDGTRRILLRRRRLDGGSREVFGRWVGFET